MIHPNTPLRRVWPLWIVLVVAMLSFGACSEKEREMPAHFFKVTDMSPALKNNNLAVFKIQELVVAQYSDNRHYMVVGEKEAKKRFEHVVAQLQTFDWEGGGFNLQDGSFFTLLLMHEETVVASQVVILK